MNVSLNPTFEACIQKQLDEELIITQVKLSVKHYD